MAVTRVLGNPVIAAPFRFVTRGRLRILTYHVVADVSRFGAQLDHIARRYTTITGHEASEVWNSGQPLPPDRLWITFDDGDISVIRDALPLLDRRGLKATAFLCGALIGTSDMPWWQVLDTAVAHGLVESGDLGTTDPATLRRTLKTGPDERRREMIERWHRRGVDRGLAMTNPQWTEADVARWVQSGHEIGNHTWDHPCIDRCTPAEQARQIELAHRRLTDITGTAPQVFAWPNGNASAAALDTLRRLDYQLVLDCDHRLTARHPDPTAVSRLKLDSDVSLDRMRAILSGNHSAFFHLSQRLRSRRPHASRP